MRQDIIWHKPFQSTPPRRGRRGACRNRDLTLVISIHAPAQGATAGDGAPTGTLRISIHAPAQGATLP